MVHQTINASSASAPTASSKITHMSTDFRYSLVGLCAAILGLLAACSSSPPDASAPAADQAVARSDAALRPAAPVARTKSRWIPVAWTDLPGWDSDRTAELWPALLRGCERPAPGWGDVCAQARSAAGLSDAAARDWLMQRLQPHRVEALDGNAEGLITGYFEPLVEASRMPRKGFAFAVHTPPADLATRKPYWTRQQLDTVSAAQASLRGRELAFVADPLDALLLQIQGSGRLRLTEADGSRKLVRLAFAGHNDQPYKSVGRWLIEQGELKADQAPWPAIRAWAQLNPLRVNELLWSNPRVVFFREEALPDPQLGPRGAQAAPLTPQRSIAVDPQSIPYGTPVWLDTTEPLSNTALRRVVMAQDTGGAITGAVRADYFWGWGDEAEAQAGRMKQNLRMWVLWPKS